MLSFCSVSESVRQAENKFLERVVFHICTSNESLILMRVEAFETWNATSEAAYERGSWLCKIKISRSNWPMIKKTMLDEELLHTLRKYGCIVRSASGDVCIIIGSKKMHQIGADYSCVYSLLDSLIKGDASDIVSPL